MADHPLDRYLHDHWPACVADVRRIVGPILDELIDLHRESRPHGAIDHVAIRFADDGALDREHFRSRANLQEKTGAAFAFRAPETFEGSPLDARVDCYAVGALLYKILTHTDPPAAKYRKPHHELTPEEYPEWPPELVSLTNRCLALSNADRFDNAFDLARALSRVPEVVPPIAEPEIESPHAASPTLDPENAATAGTAVSPEANPGERDAPVTDESAAIVAIDLPPAPAIELSAAESTPPPLPLSGPATPVAPVVQPPPLAPAKLNLIDRLPNASVGKPYRKQLRDLFGAQAERVAGSSVNIPEGCGLAFDEEDAAIAGTPTTAGEFTLTLEYSLAAADSSRPTLSHTFALTINPDPTSLWQDKRSDPAGPFAKPDFDQGSLVTPHLTAIAASRQGRSHAHEAKYRDDDFSMAFIEATGWHVFIAADGAGSAKFSRRGSQIACSTAVAGFLKRLMPDNALDEGLTKLGPAASGGDAEAKLNLQRLAANNFNQVAYEAYTAIHAEATEQKAVMRDFATTFIAVLAKRFESRWFIASFAVGDGGAGLLIDASQVRPLTQPDSGEFAGQTVFLTMSSVFQDQAALLKRAEIDFCDNFRFLAVMTDGITDPIFKSDAAFSSAAAWEQWSQELGKAVDLQAPQPGMETALQEYLKFPSPGNHDDRTLILAVPRAADPTI